MIVPFVNVNHSFIDAYFQMIVIFVAVREASHSDYKDSELLNQMIQSGELDLVSVYEAIISMPFP